MAGESFLEGSFAPDGVACRVCHCTADEGPLISPCLCDGSLKFVHRRCLDKWRLQGSERKARVSHCELCSVTYLYETVRETRSSAVSQLLLRSAALAVPFVVLEGVVSYVNENRTGAIVAGGVLCLCAVADYMPIVWTFANVTPLRPMKSIAGEASRQFRFWNKLPADEAEDMAESIVQSRAARQASSAAASIAQIGTARRAPILEMGQMGTENTGDQIDDVEFDPEQPDTGALEDSVVVVYEQDLDASAFEDDVELWMPPLEPIRPIPVSGRQRTLHRLKRLAMSLCMGLIMLLVVSFGLYGFSHEQRKHAEGMAESVELWAASFFGLGYWLGVFGLQLATTMVRPPKREPLRGADGFYKIRSLVEEERRCLSTRSTKSK